MTAPDALLDHGQDNDGIQEYDNPLPQWFVLMFYACIAFAFLYMGYYTGKSWSLTRITGKSQNLVYTGARLAALDQQAIKLNGGREFVEPHGEDLAAFLNSPTNLSRGEALFKANCVACHGEQGQGIVGPNLTDKYWLYGGAPKAVVKTISEGSVAKGMPAWKATLGPEKVHWLTSYVLSLKGKTVTNPKAPQGIEEP